MSSPFPSAKPLIGRVLFPCMGLLLMLTVSVGLTQSAHASGAKLRICADPDNLPFSNRAGQGFDNHIALQVAHDLGREPVFIWARSRRGFLREQFNKNACDVLMGVPVGMRALTTSRPYYRSSYVVVTRAREHLQIASFTDPHLNGRRIGLQVLEENLSPPSLPLIRFGHGGDLVGFESFGADAPDVVRAVADGRVGAAVVWGPLAGYFAVSRHMPVTVTMLDPSADTSSIPMTYSLAFGLHKNDLPLRDALNASILRHEAEIRRTLVAYHVPLLPLSQEER